jgi:hypothetical protein
MPALFPFHVPRAADASYRHDGIMPDGRRKSGPRKSAAR